MKRMPLEKFRTTSTMHKVWVVKIFLKNVNFQIFSTHLSGDLHFNLSPFENNRIRITGFTDFTSKIPDASEKREMTDQLLNHTKYLFPKLTWKNQRPIWVGFRPMSPDGQGFIWFKISKLRYQYIGNINPKISNKTCKTPIRW